MASLNLGNYQTENNSRVLTGIFTNTAKTIEQNTNNVAALFRNYRDIINALATTVTNVATTVTNVATTAKTIEQNTNNVVALDRANTNSNMASLNLGNYQTEKIGPGVDAIIGKEYHPDRFVNLLESIDKGKNVLKRYPYATFVPKMLLNKIEILEVYIKTDPQENVEPIYPYFSINQKDVFIDVIVYPGTFEIINGDRFNQIKVPVKPEDSESVVFFLKAKEVGDKVIKVKLYQQGTYLGKLDIHTVVEYNNALDSSDSRITTIGGPIPKPLPGPDIILYIIESGNLEYEIRLASEKIPYKKFGPLQFPFNPEEQMRSIFDDIENTKKPTDLIDDNVKSKGLTFYNDLFPKDLKTFYYENRNDINSIRVFSEEPWIPWEILKPSIKLNNGKTREDEFLCEKHSFARWIDAPDDRISKYRRFKKIKVIVPFDTELQNAKDERDWLINDFGKEHDLDISVDETYEQLKNTLENGDFDLLHFSTHGRYDSKNPLFSALKMENGYQLRVEQIKSGALTNFGSNFPLVILNACLTSAQGYSLTGIDSWANSFINAGACSFIGTAWSVNDKIAFTFTKNLYRELAMGETLGESVRISRNQCKKDGNPSWLAYQLYGHPNARIKIGGND